MYVETDFLVALAKDDDWLGDAAEDAIAEHDELYTSILSYAELLVLFYDRSNGEYEIDVPRATTNLVELVPVRPPEHEDAVLTAAAFVDEYGLTPFDALHAGLAAGANDRVLSSEGAYETVGLDRMPLRDEDGS